MTKQKTSNKPSSRTSRPLSAQPAQNTPAALALGFESWAGVGGFALFGFLLLVAPYLFSGFWPATYEYWQNSLFLGLTACVSVLLALEPTSSRRLPASRIRLLLVLFLAWCGVSVGATVYLHDSLLELARVGGVVACFFFMRTLLAPAEHFQARAGWLLAAVIVGGALICVPAIVDFLSTRNPRQFSAFYNPNLFANYSAMLLPLTAGGLLLARRRKAENPAAFIGGIIVLVVIALGLFITSSKGGFLAALCGGLVFTAAVFRAKGQHARDVLRARKSTVGIVAILALVGGGILFSQTILPRLSSNIENDHSTMFRIYTWDGTLKMAMARPLNGWGIGSFPSAYTQFAQTGYTRSAHQSWLQIAAECGFPAMLFLLAAGVLATGRGWKNLQDAENWPVAAGGLGAVAAFGVHGLTDSGWGIVSIGVLLMAVLALLEAGSREVEAGQQELRSSIHWPLLLAALPLALGSWVYQNAQTGEDLRTESRELMSRGMTSTAVERARAATKVDPASARLGTNLALALETTRQEAQAEYERTTFLQPTRALNWLDVAEYGMNKPGGSDGAQLEKKMEEAIRLDPNDPTIRLTRGNWLLKKGDARGWDDYEYVASLAGKPYGKYPATPEMVDLNFARAYAKLAARDAERKQFAGAQKFTERGLAQIAVAREYEPRRREMEIATQGRADERRAQELDELEAQFKSLQAKIPVSAKDGS